MNNIKNYLFIWDTNKIGYFSTYAFKTRISSGDYDSKSLIKLKGNFIGTQHSFIKLNDITYTLYANIIIDNKNIIAAMAE